MKAQIIPGNKKQLFIVIKRAKMVSINFLYKVDFDHCTFIPLYEMDQGEIS